MRDVATRLDRLSPEARSATVSAMDDLSRPLTGRDIDQALLGYLTRSQRRKLIRALLGSFDVIAIEPRQ